MKIAVFSDLHGNLEALDAVLDDISRCSVDHIVCAGDIVNPLPDSKTVWRRLREREIPMLRGNHEDYVSEYYFPTVALADDIRFSPRFEPVRLVARDLGQDIALKLRHLPLSLTIPGPGGHDVYICHASPLSNSKTYYDDVEGDLATSIEARPESILIAGHWHLPKTKLWRDKTLVVTGSLGLPLNGDPRAAYVLLTHKNGSWTIEHRQVEFDRTATIRRFVESQWLEKGGAISWLLVDELVSSQKRLGIFFPWLKKHGLTPNSKSEWEDCAQRCLQELGRWEVVQDIRAGTYDQI